MTLTIDTDRKTILFSGCDMAEAVHFARLHEFEGYSIHDGKTLDCGFIENIPNSITGRNENDNWQNFRGETISAAFKKPC